MIPASVILRCRGCDQPVRAVERGGSVAVLFDRCPECHGTAFEDTRTGRVVEASAGYAAMR
jgi:Zn-finger nucleic acid-binding protein